MPWGWKHVASGEISRTAKAESLQGLMVQSNLMHKNPNHIHNGFIAVEIDDDFNEITQPTPEPKS